jgi:5-(carboxyamino)imidazole ribonucleotide mutase
MGSDSDFSVMQGACEALDDFGIRYEKAIVSAHRTPERLREFATGARGAGIRVIIAGAGGAAHLPGMVAAFSELPVIGVPIPVGALQGEDALLSIVQMPKGVPVATVAIGGAYNAGVLAAQILGTGDSATLDKVRAFKDELKRAVEAKKLP